jgi:oligoribonuclease (3'-5' exoribonuclease)
MLEFVSQHVAKGMGLLSGDIHAEKRFLEAYIPYFMKSL